MCKRDRGEVRIEKVRVRQKWGEESDRDGKLAEDETTSCCRGVETKS